MIHDPLDKSRSKAVTNPKLIVEVLSDTSEGDDRGGKFNDYREIESFEEYVIITQREARVETYRRQADGTWLIAYHNGLEGAVSFRSIDATLSLKEIYASVVFDPPPGAEAPGT